ncbi:MAG: TauD/TfdA family dioxygenase [Steroidobacteraceae bacterium]
MNSSVAVKRVWSEPALLSIEWADGQLGEFASLWLRDNLREDRDRHSGQRLIDVADLPENPRIRSAVIKDGAIDVAWENEARAASFDLAWLLSQATNRLPGRAEFRPKHWLEGATLDALRDFRWAKYGDVLNSRSMRAEWLTRLLQDGIAFMSEMPAEQGAIFEAASLAGRVLETNYGMAFDVRSVPQPENLAYSDLGLGLHTDNPYREPVPGFQVLHALVTSPAGGESLFGDGFAIAEHLRAIAPEDFALLTRTAVPFLYRSQDAELSAERPLIQLACSGEVTAVHYNNRSIAPLRLAPREVGPFYGAYRRFAALLREAAFQLRFRLRDGDLAVFDNLRILHGRLPFSSLKHPRRLRGCYLSRDSVYSEAAVLRREFHPEASS